MRSTVRHRSEKTTAAVQGATGRKAADSPHPARRFSAEAVSNPVAQGYSERAHWIEFRLRRCDRRRQLFGNIARWHRSTFVHVSGDGAGSAAELLRRRRRELSLTQQQLAEVSGVSERSIRELEAGRLTRPHRATLETLGAALGYESHRLRGFIQSWEVGWLVPRPEDLDGRVIAVPHPWWPEGAQFSALRSVVGHQHVEFSADLRHVRVRDFRIVEAVADGVSDFRFFRPIRPGEVRTDLLEVVGGRTIDVDEGPQLLALHVGLDRTLDAGELAPLELNYVVERQEGAAPMTEYSAGFLYPPTVFTCTVRFLGESPRSAWRMEGYAMDDVTRVDSIEHRPGRDTLTLVVTHPSRPVVGISWEW